MGDTLYSIMDQCMGQYGIQGLYVGIMYHQNCMGLRWERFSCSVWGVYYRIYILAHLKGLATRRNLTKTEFSQVAVSIVIIQYV